MRRILLVMSVAALMAAMLLVSALPVFAHQEENQARQHRHFIDTDNTDPLNELREVGPRVCGSTNEGVKEGFQEFHHNVHIGTAGEKMDNPDNPVDVVGRGC